ncbi:HAMP domain-containing histidine kinase [Clostridioides difficile]|nr:HAMP domain-containing histidine kinase [Clostridioides difficile]HBG7285679.1 HAMP domain-containing histidine kinase [Clostridioides difficile]
MKLFLKDYKGYIFIYYIGIVMTIIYCNLMKFISFGESLYILLFSSFILLCFLIYKYYKNRGVYSLFEKGIHSLEESFLYLGSSFLGRNISVILKQQHKLYQSMIQEHKKIHSEHLTFINQWIHQMKTPISVISLQLQDYEGEEVTENIRKEIDRLNKGLDMAMHFARADNFQKDFIVEKAKLNEIVSSIVNEEKRLFIKSGMIPKIQVDKFTYVYTDVKWMKFIIGQLITNGVKYSKDYSNYLTIKSEENNKYVILSIIDEGIGIVSKDLKRVFDPFFTGENGRKFGESTGMGLYLVKKVCDDLGHKVSIKSEVGKGTEVSIYFNKDVNSLIKV